VTGSSLNVEAAASEQQPKKRSADDTLSGRRNSTLRGLEPLLEAFPSEFAPPQIMDAKVTSSVARAFVLGVAVFRVPA
jgi:hypothetical protein